jgi:outer membrane protein TolC
LLTIRLGYALALGFAFWAKTSFAEPVPTGSVLSELVRDALRANPELRAAKSRWNASIARVPQVGSLDDPQLRLMWMNSSGNPAMSTSPNDLQYRFGVNLPFPGKRSLRAQIARKDAAISKEDLRRLETEVVQRVKSAYYDLYLADKKRQVNARNTERVRELLQTVRERYGVGKAALLDILALQNELSIRLNNDVTFADEMRTATVRLNALLDRSPTTPVEVEELVEGDLPEWRHTTDELEALAGNNRAELRQAALAKEQGEAAFELANAQYKPDFMLMLDRQPSQNPTGAFDVMVTINLPFLFRKKYDYGLAEAKANIEAAESAYDAVRNSLTVEIETTLVALQAARRSAVLSKTMLIPQSEDAYEAAMTGYLTGSVDFVRLVNALISVEEMRLGYHQAVTTYLKQVAEMERIVGAELP